eukprot:scaffold8763_cov119-Isochrysis_galbana.AAC.2
MWGQLGPTIQLIYSHTQSLWGTSRLGRERQWTRPHGRFALIGPIRGNPLPAGEPFSDEGHPRQGRSDRGLREAASSLRIGGDSGSFL